METKTKIELKNKKSGENLIHLPLRSSFLFYYRKDHRTKKKKKKTFQKLSNDNDFCKN